MSNIPENLYYSQDHEWLRTEGDTAYLGVTDHAQSALGDIVFADGEPAGTELSAGDVAGVVESVKAASDIYTPVDGTVAEVNPALEETPEAINADPYGCWLVKLTLSDPGQLDALMDAAGYAAYLETL